MHIQSDPDPEAGTSTVPVTVGGVDETGANSQGVPPETTKPSLAQETNQSEQSSLLGPDSTNNPNPATCYNTLNTEVPGSQSTGHNPRSQTPGQESIEDMNRTKKGHQHVSNAESSHRNQSDMYNNGVMRTDMGQSRRPLQNGNSHTSKSTRALPPPPVAMHMHLFCDAYGREVQLELPLANCVCQQVEPIPDWRTRLKDRLSYAIGSGQGSEIQNLKDKIIENEQVAARVADALKTENRQLQDRNIKLQKENVRLEGEIQDNQKTFDNLNKHVNTIQSNRDAYSALLADEVADSVWDADFQTFFNGTETWAISIVENFPEKGDISCDPNKLSQETVDEWLRVVPIPSGQLDDLFVFLNTKKLRKKRRRCFVRGWINLVIFKMIFPSNIPVDCASKMVRSAAKDLWLPGHAALALEILEGEISDSNRSTSLDERSFHQWRTLTTSVLQKIHPDRKISSGFKAGVEKKCTEMAELLIDMAAITNPEEGDINVETVRREIYDIFEEGAGISARLRTQRGAFELRFPKTELGQPLRLNKSWMEAGKDERETVDIVVEPAIFKGGNGQGQSYHIKGPFKKARVICLKPPSETSAFAAFDTAA